MHIDIVAHVEKERTEKIIEEVKAREEKIREESKEREEKILAEVSAMKGDLKHIKDSTLVLNLYDNPPTPPSDDLH